MDIRLHLGIISGEIIFPVKDTAVRMRILLMISYLNISLSPDICSSTVWPPTEALLAGTASQTPPRPARNN